MTTKGLLLVALTLTVARAVDLNGRPNVLNDKLSKGYSEFSFWTDNSKGLLCSHRVNIGKWGSWVGLGTPTGLSIISNPTAVHLNNNATRLYVVASDGQVYFLDQTRTASGCKGFYGVWVSHSVKAKSTIPFTKGVSFPGRDGVTAVRRGEDINVFTRSYSNTSSLFMSRFDGVNYSPWRKIGGDMLSDFSVAINPYNNLFEAFASFKDGNLHRTWEWKSGSWASWTKQGYGQPTVVATARPIVHAMSSSFFNGRLEVFALGKDGKIHHIWQTTCDAVPNVWSYCTWSWWYKIENKVPPPMSKVNSFDIANNVHKGNEMFTLATDGAIWHSWQIGRGADFSNWESIGAPPGGKAVSLPYVNNNEAGWWTAHVMTSSGKMVSMTQQRTISVSKPSISYGGNTTVSWNVPKDEAANMDWIGVYPKGAGNDKYIDYRYVQGAQNPLKEPVPQGHVFMRMFLPAGQYDVRYLVNHHFVSVEDTGLVSTGSSKDPKWKQMVKGIVRGMGAETALNITLCIKDTETMIQDFENSFGLISKGKVINGLQMFGQGLKYLASAFTDCMHTELALKMLSFINDLVGCTQGDCLDFIIDVVEEVYIWYKDAYEIYGDILAAHNAIGQVKAYEQAGMSIGRIVAACMSLPDDIANGQSYAHQPRDKLAIRKMLLEEQFYQGKSRF